MYKLQWEFSNGRQWFKHFETLKEAEESSLLFGLHTHPNIVTFEIINERINHESQQ